MYIGMTIYIMLKSNSKLGQTHYKCV